VTAVQHCQVAVALAEELSLAFLCAKTIPGSAAITPAHCRNTRGVSVGVERVEERALLTAGIGVNFLGNMGGLAGGPVLIPPDTNGAVGPNDFVEFTNGAFTVFSKKGTTRHSRFYYPGRD